MKIIKINLKSAMFVTIESNREVKKERLVNNIAKNGINVPPIVFLSSDFKNDSIKFFDLLTKEEVPKEKQNENCYVVADGQHRIAAALFLSESLHKGEFDEIQAAVYDKNDLHGMKLPEFVANINSTCEKWKHRDFINMAAKEMDKDLTVQIINAMKDLGMSISTISRYLAFNNKTINDSSLVAYMKGDVSALKNIRCGRGLQVLNLLLQKNFTVPFLKKRYLIDYVISEFKHGRFTDSLSMLANLSHEQVGHIQTIPHGDLETVLSAKLTAVSSNTDDCDIDDKELDDILLDDSNKEKIVIPTDNAEEGLKLFRSIIFRNTSIPEKIRMKFSDIPESIPLFRFKPSKQTRPMIHKDSSDGTESKTHEMEPDVENPLTQHTEND